MTRPVEVDLGSPEAARHISYAGTDLFVRLEELFPGDPGELSGAELRIHESGEYTIVSALGCAIQRDGFVGCHSYGFLDGPDLAFVGASDPADSSAAFCLRLRELYPEIRPDAYSGANLTLFSGERPELRVSFGSHCVGVLRGELLGTFLACVHQRCAMETA
jgi:hypothetical protein